MSGLLNPRVKISKTGRPYVETKDLVASALGRVGANETAKNECSHDLTAPFCGRCGANLRDPRVTELRRLKDQVVEAALADRAAETGTGHNSDFDKMIATRRAFRAAVTALHQFEQEHKS
jgi:hypothetical protein